MDQSVGINSEIRVWHDRPGKNGSRTVALQAGLDSTELKEDDPYALVVKKIFDDSQNLEKVILRVNSPHILRVFRERIGRHPNVPSNFQKPTEMERPFQMLYHYWKELDVSRTEESDEAAMHLNLLFQFMEAEIGADKARCDSMIEQAHPCITWRRLWTIFRPGDLQVSLTEEGHPWLLKLEKTAYEESKERGPFMEVHCTYTDYDGQAVGMARHIFYICQKESFAAENPAVVTRLPVFPLCFHDQAIDLADRLAERGSRFLEFKGVQIKHYNGLAQWLKDPPEDFYHPAMAQWSGVYLPYTETGRVVLDRATFQQENHLDAIQTLPSGKDGGKMIGPTERALCPPFVYGWALSRKDWCKFYVDCIQDIAWNRNAFDSLIFREEQKLVLRALVSSHRFPNDARDRDRQKGKGLVILLHGTPGSGKTLTAESAAEATGKALISTTMGELNKYNHPAFFERVLIHILQYATTWEAIVLLDEADIFLESRLDDPTSGDAANRNALVAVFLRQLEYFSGIIFLTSNRVNVFDKAMKSRIHLALEYSPPTVKMRHQVWINCLKAIPPAEISMDLDEDIDHLLLEEVNGREIANTVNTGRTLARFKNEKLQLSHLETVLGIRKEFDESLSRKKTAGGAPAKHGSFALPLRQNSILLEE